MSVPTLLVKNNEYAVDQLSVVLKLNSAPLISLQLSEKLDSEVLDLAGLKKELFQAICQEQKATFAWQGTQVEFILVGVREITYEYQSNSQVGLEVVGTAINPDLQKWFNLTPFEHKNEDYLIYQRCPSSSPSSWTFLNQVLDNKFAQPNQDLLDKLPLVFPDYACIWRYKDSNNLCFLNYLVNFTKQHLSELQGWCSFDGNNPLRLILFEAKKTDDSIPKLDKNWRLDSLFVSNRYQKNQENNYSSNLSYEITLKTEQKMKLIEMLLTEGKNGEEEDKGKNFQEKDAIRLLFAPGTVAINGKNVFCHTISYKFTKSLTESPSATINLEVSYPQSYIADNQRGFLQIPGNFQGWYQTKEGENKIELAPIKPNKWAIVDESIGEIDNQRFLLAQVLSLTYSGENYSGIYIKHQKDDEMIVDIQPCEIPLVLGSVQKYRKNLEEANVTISGEKLAISASPQTQSLPESNALIIDQDKMSLLVKESTIQSEEKITLSSQELGIKSTVKISKK